MLLEEGLAAGNRRAGRYRNMVGSPGEAGLSVESTASLEERRTGVEDLVDESGDVFADGTVCRGAVEVASSLRED